MSKDLPHLAKALRQARAAAGLSQNELAKLANVSRPTIATLEIGLHQNAQADTIKKLAKALKITTSELLGAGTPARDDAMNVLLNSAIGEALEISEREATWLRALYRDWPAGELTARALFLLVEALRRCEPKA